jgi:hypothetical protein
MKSWLPHLVSELDLGKQPVLAQTLNGTETRAAILDQSGKVMAGDFHGTGVFKGAKKLIGDMLPGKPLVAVSADKKRFLLEKQSGEESLLFWKEALEGQEESWAAWLLTMIFSNNGKDLKVVRHILAAQGPWTTPRLPDGVEEWSLMPLNAGLGRLYIFGDDDIALETAALGGRIGLKVTLVTLKTRQAEAESFQNVGSFNVISFARFTDLNSDAFALLGLKTGVFVLVTTKDNAGFMEELEKIKLGWMGLAGDALPIGSNPVKIFPVAQTSAQMALGLITEMLGSS